MWFKPQNNYNLLINLNNVSKIFVHKEVCGEPTIYAVDFYFAGEKKINQFLLPKNKIDELAFLISKINKIQVPPSDKPRVIFDLEGK